MGGQDDLENSLRAIMAKKVDGLGEAPTPDELLAYRDGRLDPAEREKLAARIAVDPDAARALADLAAFPDVEPAPGTPELSDEEIDAHWPTFRQQLAELPKLRQSEPPASPRLRASRRAPHLRLAAAALAGLAVGSAAGFLTGRTSYQVPRSSVNVKIVELTPVEEGGTRAAPAPLEVPRASEELLLVLNTSSDQEFSDYEAEIENAKGVRIWSRTGLRPTAVGAFHLFFPRGMLPAGPLRVRLFGREGEARKLLGTYEVRLLP